jgi:exosortase
MNLFNRTLAYAVFIAVVVLLTSPALRLLLDLSRSDASASHLILIPFVSLVLIYRERAFVFSKMRFDWRVGTGAMLAGVLLLIAAAIYRPGAASPAASPGSLSLAVAGIWALCLGGFAALYGRDAFRAALFPLLFLAFMIPIPPMLLDGAVNVLKRGSTEAVALLFGLTGTPFHRQEYVFTLPNFVIEVADECSGIRSSIALVLTSLLAGHLFLKRAWKRALLVGLVFPFTILKNGIRIVALSFLAIHVDPSFLSGRLHRDGGVVFFLIALALMFPLFALLCRSEREPAASAERAPRTPETSEMLS